MRRLSNLQTDGVEYIDDKAMYHQALTDLHGIGQETLDTLIERYPYSQPLRHVWAKKRHQDGAMANAASALLFADSKNWLYGYVLNEDEDSLVQPADVHVGRDPIGSPTPLSETDYFRYQGEPEKEGMEIAETTTQERVALYHDEHMPYSFRWWLYKTRMAHADTYQPYAPTRTHPHGMETPDLEEVQVLDQQIRENIFHLQSPEEKMSAARPPLTVPFQPSKKIDPILERFIREEPQIKPPTVDRIDLENKARKSAEDQLTLVTETLAKIYSEQGLYPKAIVIYKKLSLKYPEKSAYFAAQISELENKLR